MNLRTAGSVCGLLGGLAWLLRWVLSAAGTGPGAENAAYWVGASLLSAGALVVGAGLVSRSAAWLRGIVALCSVLLVWSVLPVLHRAGSDAAVDGVCGAIAALVAGTVLLRRPRRTPSRPTPTHSAPDRVRRPSGSHAR